MERKCEMSAEEKRRRGSRKKGVKARQEQRQSVSESDEAVWLRLKQVGDGHDAPEWKGLRLPGLKTLAVAD